jgi:hypothetical protein
MKMTFNRAVMCSILILMGSLFAQPGWAASVVGRVTFLGTIDVQSDGTSRWNRFRIRISESTCDQAMPKERWIVVRSDRLDPDRPDRDRPSRAADYRNAYSTLLAAFLSGNSVQIDAPSLDCRADIQVLEITSMNIGIF